MTCAHSQEAIVLLIMERAIHHLFASVWLSSVPLYYEMSSLHSLKPHRGRSEHINYKLLDLGAINAVENIKSLGK